jgi:hypothetical protein
MTARELAPRLGLAIIAVGALVLAVELVLLASRGLWREGVFWLLLPNCVLPALLVYDQLAPPSRVRRRALNRLIIASALAITVGLTWKQS